MATVQEISPDLASTLFGTGALAGLTIKASEKPGRTARGFLQSAVRTFPGPTLEQRKLEKLQRLAEAFRNFVATHQEYRDGLVSEVLDDEHVMAAYGEFIEARHLADGMGDAPGVVRPDKRSTAPIPLPTVLVPELRERWTSFQELQKQVNEARLLCPGVTLEVGTAQDDLVRDALWFMYDPLVPPEFADALLGIREMDVAYALLAMAYELGTWDVAAFRKLAEQVMASYRRYAIFINGLEGANIPLLRGERLNHAEILGRHLARRHRREQLGQEAVAALTEPSKRA